MKDRIEIVRNQIKLLTEQYTEHYNECLDIVKLLRPYETELRKLEKQIKEEEYMREILFRAKNIATDDWVYGYYIKHETRQRCVIGNDNLADNEIIHLIARDGFADWNMPKQLEIVKIKVDTLGQFIGLTDENRQRIFEGDIVSLRGGEYYLGFWEYNDTITVKDIAQNLYEISHYEQIEVIGNIYDNESEGK